MKFADELKKTLDEEFNVAVTENGALSYRTTGKPLLDMNFSVSSTRNENSDVIEKRFAKAFFANKLLAIKWLFYAGDVRGGMGERRLFRICLNYLANTEPKLCERLLPLVAEYTRWDNLLPLLKTSLKESVCALFKEQLKADILAMEKGKTVSLLAKWLPSINATSPASKEYAKILIKELSLTQKEYRKTLVVLRKYLNVVEVTMSEKAWGDIDYEAVPSKANLLYNAAFLKNDEERRKAFLEKLKKGEVKINADVLYPHDIVHRYTSGGWSVHLKEYDETLEQLWKGLPDYVKGEGNTICVADGSGSMTITLNGTTISALDVANALAIYFAERSSGDFKDKYITFSDNPQLVDFSGCKSLHDKLGVALSHDEVATTNIEGVFDLILTTAVKKSMKQEEMPKNVLILSDMEFNYAVDVRDDLDGKKLFQVIQERYEEYGYKLPRIVFWNICSRTGAIPLKENKLGVALVSGFSPTTLDMVMSSKLDPLDCLVEQLSKERYQPVEDAVKDLLQ